MIFSYDRSGQFVRNGEIAEFGQNGPLVNYKLSFCGIRSDTVNLRVNLRVNLDANLEVNLDVNLEVNFEVTRRRSREESRENRFPCKMKRVRRNWALMRRSM